METNSINDFIGILGQIPTTVADGTKPHSEQKTYQKLESVSENEIKLPGATE